MKFRAKAPLRIPFAGGGTDVSPYCDEYGGVCLAATIDKYAYANYGDRSVGLSSEELEVCRFFDIPHDKIEIRFFTPSQAGLGGSASAFIAAVMAVLEAKGEPVTPDKVAKMAFDIERDGLKAVGGFQDQVAATYGGLLKMEFPERSRCIVTPLHIPKGFEELLFLHYTGTRTSTGRDIIKDQIERYNKRALDDQRALAILMADTLSNGDLLQFGKLLNQAWQSKKAFSPLVSTKYADSLEGWALANGAIGMRLCGAGGGGYALIMAHPQKRKDFLEAAKRDKVELEPVTFDTEGGRIV